MVFVSYAPNCEDVPLWRALRDVPSGRYVDWQREGAAGASVTRAFYDRGWSGLSVCPDAGTAAELAASRPRDTVRTAGTALPLAVDGPVHFLRADGRSLRCMDLSTLRPWIVVAPDLDADAAGVLADAGYGPTLFDGLNRFHLSPDHPELAPHLAAPANRSDGYVRAADTAPGLQVDALQAALRAAELRVEAGQQRVLDATRTAGRTRSDSLAESEWMRGLVATAQAQRETEGEWLRGQLDAARAESEERLRQIVARADEVAWLRGCLADSDANLRTTDARLREMDARASALDAHLRHAEALAAQAQRRVHDLQGSLSWRITEPLRRTRGLLWPARPEPAPAAPPAVPAMRPSPPSPPPMAGPVATAHRVGNRLQPTPPAPVQPPAPPVVAVDRMLIPSRPQGPVTAVHQFHAGSSPHDAITNAMLLIRHHLRSAGFRSDIYVESRGAGLDEDIRLLDALPDHPGYVLLHHHSMGHPGFDEVIARPAAKLLFYHNITPAEFLRDVPRIQRQVEQGQRQLAALRDHVVFALADSDFNAVELYRLGFPAVRTCPLLFDVARMDGRKQAMRPDDGVFTVLFVGRVTPSKAQDALVDAFAAFRARFAQPCRLVLVGALDPDEHAFLDRIDARIAAHSLAGTVHLTGLVSDAELDGWYRDADLYVSLSQHEGFGVPLVEALANGVPVIAWPTGAVPFTLGDAGTLLTTRDPADVAAAMLAAVTVAPRPARLERFALDRQWPVLINAVAAAGALPPVSRDGRAALAGNMRFAVTGHVRGSYSLAAVNRSLARAIERERPGAVRLRPVEGQPTDDLAGIPDAEQDALAAMARRPPSDTGPELLISAHYPVHVPAQRGDVTAALFFWEESLVPAATVATLNAEFDAVLAPSSFVAKVLVDSGVFVPVAVIGLAPDLSALAALPVPRTVAGPFSFLHVSSAFPRKGLDVLLAAWAAAFTATDPVRLVIKTFPNPHNDAAAQIAHLRAERPDLAEIVLIDEDLSPDAVVTLSRDAHAAVLPTRGEGYNLPAAEAMAAGLPLIVTAHGGQQDFCTPATARLVRRSFATSGSHLAPPFSLWAEPDPADLAVALREAATGSLAGLVAPARTAIAASTDRAGVAARLADIAACVLVTPPAAPLRLSWVSSWDVRCGIAEYSRHLLEALPRDGLAEPVILADDRTAADAQVRPAWRAGDAASVDRLLVAIDRFDPEILMVQHQPGLLPWPGLAQLLHVASTRDRSVVTTLHNTLHLLDIPTVDRAAAISALRGVDRVLVHTLSDLNTLDRLGLTENVTLLPHPAPAPVNVPTRPLPPDATPVVGCTGFFLPDKGIGPLISAVARLRSRWPAIRLRLVNAEYDDPSSAAEIAACREAALAQGVTIEWHTAFMALEQQRTLLSGCDVVVLPYQRSKEGSSAALRSALGSGVPVAVTPLPLFDEAAAAVFRLPGTEPAAMALGIGSLLSSMGQRASLAADARDWLAERAMQPIARRLNGLLRGLAAQRGLAAMRQPSS